MSEYTKEQVRAYLTKWHFETGGDALAVVRRLNSVQFDPLNVVGRNPDLVLQSRVKNYRTEMLTALLYEKRALIDGFDKMLCIYPAEDYPYLKRLRDGTVRWFRENPQIQAAAETVLAEIRARGPLCSDDLDMNEKVNWPWGPTRLSRATLESMWMSGTLAVHHKKGVRRYYDLAERHFPHALLDAPDPNPTDEEYFAWQLYRRLLSVGILGRGPSDAFLGMEGFRTDARARAFDRLRAEGRVTPVTIKGLRGEHYVPSSNMPLLNAALDTPCKKTARVLAPLDNLMWDRKLIQRIFGFHYQWEVYTPVEKRRYGYYVLPIMYADRFIARFEPENFREGAFTVKHFWWEDGVRPTKAMRAAVEKCFGVFAAYLGATGIEGDIFKENLDERQ